MFKVFNFFVQLYSFFQYYSIQFERKYWHPFLLNYFGEPVEEVTVAYVKEGIKIGDATDEIHDYDFIVYKKGIHLQIIPYPERLNLFEDNIRELSKIRFLALGLKIGSDTLEISFFEENSYNYYLVGNKIDKNLLKYIINTHYSDGFVTMFGNDFSILDTCDYELSIIDHNANFLTINKSDSIIIEQSEYHII